MNRRQFITVATLASSGALAGIPLYAQESAQESAARFRLTLGSTAGSAVPVDYLGFSCETAQLADPTYFAADNHELVSLFKTLAPQGILRLGGNSSEFCWWKTSATDQPPELPASAHGADNWMPHSFTAIEPVAVDRLVEFLQATGWNAIYGLNLGTGSPERAAEEAAYVARKLGKRLLFFQIGNEPEFYRDANNRLRSPDWNFDQYLAQWMTFAKAVIARVPEARFGGPDIGSNAQWVTRFAREAPPLLPGRIVACSGHYYVMGPPDNPSVTAQRLLAPDLNVDREVPRIISVAGETGCVSDDRGQLLLPWRQAGSEQCLLFGALGGRLPAQIGELWLCWSESSWRWRGCHSRFTRRASAGRKAFARWCGHRGGGQLLHSHRWQPRNRFQSPAGLLWHEVGRDFGRR